METLHAVPIEQIRCLKIIRVIGLDWNPFIGHLPYLRSVKEGYDYRKSDILDDAIMERIKITYPNSILIASQLLLFTNQLERMLKSIEGGTMIPFHFIFTPQFDLDFQQILRVISAKTYYAYPFEFNLRLNLHPHSEKIQYIHHPGQCLLPYQEIEKLVETLEKA